MLYGMDEGRKRVLLIAASILAARRLANWDGKPSPAFVAAISDAVRIAEWDIRGRAMSMVELRVSGVEPGEYPVCRTSVFPPCPDCRLA
jgi:hypothetical protein